MTPSRKRAADRAGGTTRTGGGGLRGDANVPVRCVGRRPRHENGSQEHFNPVRPFEEQGRMAADRPAVAAAEEVKTAVQETRLWDASARETFRCAGKDAHDYRYSILIRHPFASR